MRFRASDVAAATGGRLIGPDVEIDGAAFDSRAVCPGQLFVPLIAARDGHDFIDGARASGAAAYLTSRRAGMGTAVEVDDTLRALMDLARRMRRTHFAGTVIGITGSVGKTSTKDLALAALSASRTAHANERSFNNDQGLPTTILNTPDGTAVLVVEMGMRGPGEIARLCDIAAPHIGVVTRVAEAHGDLVGGIEGVARAKAELVAALPADGAAVLNADDARVRAMAGRSEAPVVTFGESATADVHIDGVVLDELARPSFTARTPWGTVEVRLGVSGRHMALNAAAALACVGVVGGDVAAGAAALAGVGLSPMRMQLVRTASGGLIINDCYNANPTSMRAAFATLADLPARRRVALLGMMAEIADAAAEHEAILADALERGIEVIPVGTDLYGIAPTDDPVAAVGSIAGGDALLVKGSRVVGLERWVAVLQSM
ncbi:MAG: UDP-N-acetylmuramoyl-tripeptide--D-alanyl-D-alanine ligase [Ilumatobacteraceae bacterium]